MQKGDVSLSISGASSRRKRQWIKACKQNRTKKYGQKPTLQKRRWERNPHPKQRACASCQKDARNPRHKQGKQSHNKHKAVWEPLVNVVRIPAPSRRPARLGRFLSRHRHDRHATGEPARGLGGAGLGSGAHRVRSNQLLEPASATDWSMTHSPTPRYLSIHLFMSLFSPEAFSVLKLGLAITPNPEGKEEERQS